MSETPRPDPDEPDRPQEPDFAAMFEQLLGDPNNPAMAEALRSMGINSLDPAAMGMIAGQLSALFSGGPDDGINLELSADVARKTVAAGGDTTVPVPQQRSVADSVRVADLWLDDVTELSGTALQPVAWSRAEYVDRTMPMWGRLVEPVATGVNHAVASAMRSQFEQLSSEGGTPMIPGMPAGLDLGAVLGQFEPMLARMSSSLFGAQIGQAVGGLAADVLSGTEVGLPLVPAGTVALLPANIAAFADGLEVDNAQVEIYLGVREAARVRLFADVAWLGPQLIEAVRAYARDISIDTEGLEAKVSSLDPTDAEAMQRVLAEGLFSPTPSEAQKRALARLETLLALVEGWVDVVVEHATTPHLPQAAALGEAVRRRRASGGPAEHLFSRLVGLELRPRRLRDAANLFAALENAGGAAARDAAWAHPDVAPTADDLDDVLGYVERARSAGAGGAQLDDLDAALADILDGSPETDAGSPGRAPSSASDDADASGGPQASGDSEEDRSRGDDDPPAGSGRPA